MKPFSFYYEEEVRKWLQRPRTNKLPFLKFPIFFGGAYLNAVDMRKAINGFRRTEFWPLDRNIFSRAHFLPAAKTDMAICTSHTAPCEKPNTSAVSKITGVFLCRTEELRRQAFLV
jgi:hypothetical protein